MKTLHIDIETYSPEPIADTGLYKYAASPEFEILLVAYARKTETFPRQCVFFATTNEPNFLKGSTGNRRFWTVECGEDITTKDVWDDLPGEVDQIWAEAE